MVSSRQRTSAAAAANTATPGKETSNPKAVPKAQLDEWTVREKLYLASLALKHNNSWNTVARQMQSFIEKGRPDGFSNQKTCAAQFDKLMNELGVDKRPKRNEPSDTTGSVIYKKMTEKRMKELEENIVEYRNAWLKICDELESSKDEQVTITKEIKQEPATSGKQRGKQQPSTTAKASAAASTKANTSISSESEKPPTRALTRRESSRQNLEKTFSILHHEAAEHKGLIQLCKPPADVEKALGSYDKVVLKHVDMNTIKKKFSGDIQDPHALMTDFLLMFQNAIMYYPVDHPTHTLAVELRDKLVPHWEKQIFERHRGRH